MNYRPTDLLYLLPTLLVCAALYFATVSSSIAVVDAGLFMMVCDANGIAHPPGYPLATLICHPMMSLPFEGVIPGNLFSTLFAILAVGALYFLCRLIDLSEVESSLAAGLMAVSTAFWSQSIVLEVYTLNSFLFICVMICCFCFSRAGDGRWLVAGSLFLGLGLANHWPLIVASSLCLLPFLFWKIGLLVDVLKRPLLIAGCLLAFVLGLSPYLLMFTKSGNPMTMIGDVNTLSDLWLYISRSTFEDSFINRPEGWLGLLWWIPLASIKQFGYLGLLLVPLGMLRSLVDLSKPVAASLWLLWVANCLLLPLLNGSQFNEVAKMYYATWILLSFVSCSIWMVLGVRFLWAMSRSQAVTRSAIAFLVFVTVAVQSFPLLGANDTVWVEHYNRLLLESLEENALLIVAGDTQTGPLGTLHHVQEVRPDIELRQRHNMLFGNRLANPRVNIDEQARLLAEYIGSTDRPVYSIDAPDGSARDYGMYFRLGEEGFGFNRELDAFMHGLMTSLQEDAVREPFIKGYLNNVLSRYVRAVVGDALLSQGLSKEQLVRLLPVTETFQAKIWTLHHLVNTPQPSMDLEQFANLVVEGEQQIEADVQQGLARQFLLLAGDAYREILDSQDSAIISYQRARKYDVDRETCEHLAARHLSELLPQVGCGN
ncbi:DUF2723 domain-containing protein [Gammaproteobacteria bacterium]|nr:DUF2723 domain-containing protein [Gammaproteobacteria bacterium]